MRANGNATTCDVCGNHPVVKTHHRADYCAECWVKRSEWDEGARFAALKMIGAAVQILKEQDAERWAIYAAVDAAIAGPQDPRDEWEGIHTDEAIALAAHIGHS